MDVFMSKSEVVEAQDHIEKALDVLSICNSAEMSGLKRLLRHAAVRLDQMENGDPALLCRMEGN